MYRITNIYGKQAFLFHWVSKASYTNRDRIPVLAAFGTIGGALFGFDVRYVSIYIQV